MQILVVEHHPNVRALLGEVLTFAGHSCVAVADGSAALRAIDAGTVDIVLTDLELRVTDALLCDGVMLAQLIRRRTPDLPILCLAHDPDDNRLTAHPTLFDAVLAKPCSLTTLCAAFETHATATSLAA